MSEPDSEIASTESGDIRESLQRTIVRIHAANVELQAEIERLRAEREQYRDRAEATVAIYNMVDERDIGQDFVPCAIDLIQEIALAFANKNAPEGQEGGE